MENVMNVIFDAFNNAIYRFFTLCEPFWDMLVKQRMWVYAFLVLLLIFGFYKS